MAPRSAAARSQDPASYFRKTRPFIGAMIVGAMVYYGFAVLAPSKIPYEGLGPLGKLTQYLQQNHKTVFHGGYAAAWLIHVGEAFLSLWLCKKKGITDGKTQLLWFVQTFLFGFGSLYLLLGYKPARKTQ